MKDRDPDLENLEVLQRVIGIRFNNKALLRQALTHDSIVCKSSFPYSSNERLEFLGDSVLGFVVSGYLFRRFPDLDEGALANMKSYVVSTEFLASRAKELNLGDHILIGKGEESTGGREKPSLLAGFLESVVGAIYLDQGLEAAESFLIRLFEKSFEKVEEIGKDSKSLLQEHTQKHFRGLPVYRVVREHGPPHRKIFEVQVSFGGEILGEGIGCRKKEAEKQAARQALINFRACLATLLSTEREENGR